MYKDNVAHKKAYNKGKIPRPSNLMPSNTEQYYLSWCKYIYGKYCADGCYIGYGGLYHQGKGGQGRSIAELRAYANGSQSVEKYKSVLDRKAPGSDKSLMNISWDTVRILPKFTNIIMGKMDDYRFAVSTQAIDGSSNDERLNIVNKMRLQVRPEMKALREMTGVGKDSVDTMGLESEKDIITMNKMGGIRLATEIMLKDACDVTLQESGYNTSIEQQLQEDLINIGMISTHTYLEKATGVVKMKYVDPEKLIVPSSSHVDFKDIQYGAYIEEMTISELRLLAPELEEKDIWMIAKSYANQEANKNLARGQNTDFDSRESYYRKNGCYQYDGFRVSVMNVNFIASEAEDRMVHSKAETLGEEVPNEAPSNVIESCYRARWVIGSKYIFDYGKEYAIVKGKNGQAQLPLRVYTTNTPSIVERCISFVDDIHHAVYKRRNTLAKLPPGPRMVLDKSILRDSVTIGKQKYTMLDLINNKFTAKTETLKMVTVTPHFQKKSFYTFHIEGLQ